MTAGRSDLWAYLRVCPSFLYTRGRRRRRKRGLSLISRSFLAIGFVGCIDDDEDLSVDYKSHTDFAGE
jgi:hypothetical protein